MSQFTNITNGQVTLGDTELTNLMKRLVQLYHFRNHNQDPTEIVIPILQEVNGIPIKYVKEVDVNANDGGQTNTRKPRRVGQPSHK